jgi:hypothetical protein
MVQLDPSARDPGVIAPAHLENGIFCNGLTRFFDLPVTRPDQSSED